MTRLVRSRCVDALPIVLGLLLTACGSGGGGSGGVSSLTFDGEWSGTWSEAGPISESATALGTVEISLDQVSADLSGTATFGGHPCVVACSVACRADGESVSGSFDAGPFRMAFQALCPGPHEGGGPHGGGRHHDGAHHDFLQGTYEILGGPCAGERGTVDLTRVGPTAAGEETGSTLVGSALLIDLDEGEVVRLPVVVPAGGD